MAKKEKEEKKVEGSARPTHESQEEDWLKKLGAVPADTYYEDSPEIGRIEEAVSASEGPAAHPEKEESPESRISKRVCIHFTREMALDGLNSGADVFCPVRVALEEAKTAFKDTLTEGEKEMEVRPEYLPCHLCPKYEKLGQEHLKKYRLRRDQIEFLKEFDPWEERPISNPRYLDKVNYSRKRSAERLEGQKLIRTVGRFLRNPTNPQKPEPTLIANLSVLGYIASGKDEGSIEKDLPKVLLQKPMRVVATYVENLSTEMEHLGEFIKTRKQQRTSMGWDITLGIVELKHQYDFIMKFDAFLAENGISMNKILSPEDPVRYPQSGGPQSPEGPVGGGQSAHHQSPEDSVGGGQSAHHQSSPKVRE